MSYTDADMASVCTLCINSLKIWSSLDYKENIKDGYIKKVHYRTLSVFKWYKVCLQIVRQCSNICYKFRTLERGYFLVTIVYVSLYCSIIERKLILLNSENFLIDVRNI